MGRYDDCLQIPDFHYILASIPKALPIPMALGLCIPTYCTIADFDALKPNIIEALNGIIIDLFDDVKGFNPQMKLKVDDLKFGYSCELNKEVTKVGALSIIMILVILFFTLTTIVSTLVLWLRRKQDRKERYAR